MLHNIIMIHCMLPFSSSFPLSLFLHVRVNGQEVAIKIIKNVPKYRAAAKIEIRVLEQIKELLHDGQE